MMFELSPFFSQNGLNSLNMIKNGLMISILLILYIKNKHRKTNLPNNTVCFILLMSILIISEIITGIGGSYGRIVGGLVLMSFASLYSDRSFFYTFLNTICIVTLITTLPLIYYYYTLGYYARWIIIFDKSFQTFLFGVSMAYITMRIFDENQKYKLLLFAVVIYLLWVNVYILQSKTSIFSFLVLLCLLVVFKTRTTLGFFKRKWYVFAIIIIAFIFSPIQLEIPDAMKQAANKLLGKEQFHLSVNMRENTYDVRDLVVKKTREIIVKNPLQGAGFGNYEEALRSTGTFLTEGESQIVDMALDGGVTYLIVFFLYVFLFMYRGIYNIRHKINNEESLMLVGQMTVFVILCFGNEMFSSLVWIYMGTISWLMYSKLNTIN